MQEKRPHAFMYDIKNLKDLDLVRNELVEKSIKLKETEDKVKSLENTINKLNSKALSSERNSKILNGRLEESRKLNGIIEEKFKLLQKENAEIIKNKDNLVKNQKITQTKLDELKQNNLTLNKLLSDKEKSINNLTQGKLEECEIKILFLEKKCKEKEKINKTKDKLLKQYKTVRVIDYYELNIYLYL